MKDYPFVVLSAKLIRSKKNGIDTWSFVFFRKRGKKFIKINLNIENKVQQGKIKSKYQIVFLK